MPFDVEIFRYPKLDSGPRPTRDFSLDFDLPNVLTNDPEEAKKMFLSSLLGAINILNTTPQIRPYLERFPIDYEMFSASMCMNNKEKSTGPFIGAVSYFKGEIRVVRWTYNEESNKWSYDECLTVSSKELGDILSPNGLLNNERKREILIRPHKCQKDFLIGAETWFAFADEFAKKEGGVFTTEQWYLRFGLTTYEERVNVGLGGTYSFQEKRLTLEEARQFIRKASREHLEFAQKDATAIRQVKRCQEENKRTVDGKARQENLSLRFLFWDKYIDYVQPPYIAEIYTFSRKAYYFTVDERQRPVLMFQEELPSELDELKE